VAAAASDRNFWRCSGRGRSLRVGRVGFGGDEGTGLPRSSYFWSANSMDSYLTAHGDIWKTFVASYTQYDNYDIMFKCRADIVYNIAYWDA